MAKINKQDSNNGPEKTIEELQKENELLKQENEEALKLNAELQEMIPDEDVKAVQPALTCPEVETKSGTYKFLVPKFKMAIDGDMHEITSEHASKSPELMAQLIEMEVGFLQKVN